MHKASGWTDARSPSQVHSCDPGRVRAPSISKDDGGKIADTCKTATVRSDRMGTFHKEEMDEGFMLSPRWR